MKGRLKKLTSLSDAGDLPCSITYVGRTRDVKGKKVFEEIMTEITLNLFNKYQLF